MEFTNVLPGVKLVKQDEAGNEEELFVSQNDNGKSRYVKLPAILPGLLPRPPQPCGCAGTAAH